MYINAWLIGEDTEHVLDDLIAPDDYPQAHVWIPLESAHTGAPGFRSGYGFRETGGEQWIDFAVPPSVVRESLGPQAMVNPKWLATGKALRSNVRDRDGVLMVKVPRYFATFGSAWTFEQVGYDPLITRNREVTAQTTVGELDLMLSFRRCGGEPVVLIDEAGPRMFSRRHDGYYNVAGLTPTSEVLDSISTRPADTPVRCAWCTF